MAKTIGKFAPVEVPNLPASFDSWIAEQTGYNDRLGLIPASISPTVLNSIREEAASGRLGRLYELYEKMVATDARIGGIVGSLRATVSGLPLKTQRAETASAGEVRLAEDYRGVVREALLQMDTHSFTKDLTDVYLNGTMAFQLSWRVEDYPRGKKIALPNNPARIPGQSLEQEMEFQHKNYGELKVIELSKPLGTFFKDIDPRRAFVINDGTVKGRHDVVGALRRVLGWWITKTYAQLWWIEYVESFGQPMRIARYAPESGSRERAELKNFVKNIGRQKWGMFPQGADVQLLEAVSAGQINTFSDIINMANHEIAVALVGQTGITQDSAQGSRAKLEVLNGVRIEIVTDIGAMVSKGYNALADAILKCNYGDAYIKRLRPITRPTISRPGANKDKVDVYTKLTTAGVPVSLDEISDQTGIPQPELGQLVLFKGVVMEMSTITKMQEEIDERNADILARQESLSGGKEKEGSTGGGSDGGEKNKGSDSKRTVPPAKE